MSDEYSGTGPLTADYGSIYCQWAEDGDFDYSEGWKTECGNSFILTAGTPAENDMKYCCYCGRQLVEVETDA